MKIVGFLFLIWVNINLNQIFRIQFFIMIDSSVMKNNNNNNVMTNSWIASPPLIKHDESSINVHHFNPIENLLIEHASMKNDFSKTIDSVCFFC